MSGSSSSINGANGSGAFSKYTLPEIDSSSRGEKRKADSGIDSEREKRRRGQGYSGCR